jgi:hypothetical protein
MAGWLPTNMQGARELNMIAEGVLIWQRPKKGEITAAGAARSRLALTTLRARSASNHSSLAARWTINRTVRITAQNLLLPATRIIRCGVLQKFFGGPPAPSARAKLAKAAGAGKRVTAAFASSAPSSPSHAHAVRADSHPQRPRDSTLVSPAAVVSSSLTCTLPHPLHSRGRVHPGPLRHEDSP